MSAGRFAWTVAVGLLVPALSFGQALDGPRAWLPFEEGPNDVSAAWVHRFGDLSPSGTLVLPGTSVDTDLVVASYSRMFPMSALFFGLAGISLPVGIAHASGTISGQPQQTESTGLGDLELSFAGGMQPQRDLTAGPWSPAFTLLAQLAVTSPTGAYDAWKLANLGDNRFAIRTSMPLTLSFGAVGRQTTFELVPAVTIFTDNNHPLEGETKSQSALGRLETHAGSGSVAEQGGLRGRGLEIMTSAHEREERDGDDRGAEGVGEQGEEVHRERGGREA